jgi:hypothetical protein
VHSKSSLAFGVSENAHSIVRVCMHRTHNPSGIISTDGNQAEIKWSLEFADLFECGADWELVLWAVVIGTLRKLWNSPVSRIPKYNKLAKF